MQRYMLRLMMIFAVIGLLSAPMSLFRWLRRGSAPRTGGTTPILHRPAA
jgi:hypothetical protein